ncbi:MAG: MFS transporter [Chloroflexota bacterium]|nr:MFS transporter [Chloroflexota bacterium]
MKYNSRPMTVLLPLGFAASFSLFGDLTLYAVLASQREVVALSLGAVGVMLGINRMIRIPGNTLIGVFLDRWGRRRIFLVGMLLGVLSTAAYGLVNGFWPFLLSRLCWGIGWTCINVGGMAMVMDISTPENRGRLSGSYNLWLWVGFAVGPLVGGFLVDWLGFRTAMLICSALTALGLWVALFALPETAGPAAGRQPKRDWWRRFRTLSGRQLRELLHTNRYLAVVSLILLITQFTGEGIALSTISFLLQQRLSVDLSWAGLTLGVASAGGLLLALRSVVASGAGILAGQFSDRRGSRWPVIAGSLVLGMIAFAGLMFASTPWAIVWSVALSGLSGGMAMASLAAQMGDLAPPGQEGLAMGAYATVGDVGSMSGPFLAYALLPVWGLSWLYFLCIVIFLAGLGLLSYAYRHR